MNSDGYENYRFSLDPMSGIVSANAVNSEDWATCELLADLGDDLSWELVFELAAQVDRKNVIGLTMTGTTYEAHWRARRSLRNRMLKEMRCG
jgi:hypothetical protein